jgi:hypothetical protein
MAALVEKSMPYLSFLLTLFIDMLKMCKFAFFHEGSNSLPTKETAR